MDQPALLPLAVGQATVERGIPAMSVGPAPVSGRAAEHRMWFGLIVAVRERPIVWRVAAMAPWSAPCVGAASARHLNCQRFLADIRSCHWCRMSRSADGHDERRSEADDDGHSGCKHRSPLSRKVVKPEDPDMLPHPLWPMFRLNLESRLRRARRPYFRSRAACIRSRHLCRLRAGSMFLSHPLNSVAYASVESATTNTVLICGYQRKIWPRGSYIVER